MPQGRCGVGDTARSVLVALALLGAAAVASCTQTADDVAPAISGGDARYVPGDDTCTPDHFRTLPEGKARDELVDACMRRGEYRSSVPVTW